MPDALPRLPRSDVDSLWNDLYSSGPLAFADPRGSLLNGMFLDHLTPAGVEGQHPQSS